MNDENARAVLMVFRVFGSKPGTTLSAEKFDAYVRISGEGADLNAGLLACSRNGWVEGIGREAVKLTDLGYVAMLENGQ